MISENLPNTFKSLKKFRALFDYTEFRCQSPSIFKYQGTLYSAYKASTTFEVFVACIPNGGICFVSDVYEGSISDHENFIKSKYAELLESGDLVIGNCGFTVHDVIEARQAYLNIAFFLMEEAVIRARRNPDLKNC